ncbi:DNA cytosine methyltransferase [Latilactobacillus sakei]|uniref:DNA cytosine methyltransferase n=1 Tax=Latilactobacillus sakei TaxID=1599 RepID=UPI000C6F1043|nr:DNA (cytosine-5-)-methyltransferase [Latilactobacillus sakei]
MKFIDLFAGIGGFRSGLEMAGHECVGFVEIDKFARRSYRAIYDTEGEWTEHDIRAVRASELPRADIWTFGFPCQDISVAGKQKGFAGKRSSLFFTVTGLIRDLEEEDRPSILLIENVKNLLSINGGWDFLKLQVELDEIGYDVEWDVLDTAEVLPQHRERVYIVGHLRGRGGRKVFPIRRGNEQAISQSEQNTNTLTTRYGESQGSGLNVVEPKPQKVKQIGNIVETSSFGGNPQVGRVYDPEGLSPALNTMQGGGREPKILIKEATKKGCAEGYEGDSVSFSQPNSKTRRGRIGAQITNTLETGLNQGAIIKVKDTYRLVINGIEYAIRVRKLTPLECWRLQGFTDEQFYKAQAVNSNSQLYKQAGNSVSVPVVYAVAKHLNINA